MKRITTLLVIALIGFSLNSCKKDPIEYQVRIYNLMQNELIGYPFMRYEVSEFKLGENVITNVAYGEFSNYVTVVSDKDYPVSIVVNKFLYNIDTGIWLPDGNETFNIGPETWGRDDEKTKQVIQLKIGTLLQLYKPVYTVHYDPDQD